MEGCGLVGFGQGYAVCNGEVVWYDIKKQVIIKLAAVPILIRFPWLTRFPYELQDFNEYKIALDVKAYHSAYVHLSDIRNCYIKVISR